MFSCFCLLKKGVKIRKSVFAFNILLRVSLLPSLTHLFIMRSLFIGLFLSIPIGLTAQGGKRAVQQIPLSYQDHAVNIQVLPSGVKLKPKIDRMYYWLKSMKVHTSRGAYEGKLLHGSYSAFYRNNNLKEKGQFKKGLKHGIWKTWYSNGELEAIVTWKNGMRQGITKTYTLTGELLTVTHYHNDVKHGRAIVYQQGVPGVHHFKNGEEVVPKVKEEVPEPKAIEPVKQEQGDEKETPKKKKEKKKRRKTAEEKDKTNDDA